MIKAFYTVISICAVCLTHAVSATDELIDAADERTPAEIIKQRTAEMLATFDHLAESPDAASQLVDLITPDALRNTLLAYACREQRPDIIQCFLNHGAPVHATAFRDIFSPENESDTVMASPTGAVAITMHLIPFSLTFN
ncbi:MAG: hypothetical protein V4482_04660 [Pseudomonadota bacterium]